jgi:hypothetical protein
MHGIGKNNWQMLKKVLLPVFCLFMISSHAQYDSQKEYVSRYRPGVFWFFSGLMPAKEDKPEKYDRLIFDLTYNDWIGDQGPFQNHWASIGLNTNFMFDIPMTKKSDKVSFGIGLSHSYTNIRHNNHLIPVDSIGATIFALKDTSDNFYKSTLTGNSFSIPIEFRFRTGGWRHFKVHIGGKIGYQANLISKYASKVNGDKVLTKRYGFPDKNDLIYSAHVRIGLRNWALYASYNFNTIFKNSQSTQLNMLQMGLSISLF